MEANMKTKSDANDETKLAQEIVAVLPAGSVARFCSDDAETIRFVVQEQRPHRSTRADFEPAATR